VIRNVGFCHSAREQHGLDNPIFSRDDHVTPLTSLTASAAAALPFAIIPSPLAR
jgi:hypothetical protein